VRGGHRAFGEAHPKITVCRHGGAAWLRTDPSGDGSNGKRQCPESHN